MNLRIVAIAGAAVAVVVAALLYFVLSSIDGIVKSAIEDFGSDIVGTTVRVGSVKIELQEGRGTIRGLRVANPSGFPSGDAISFGEITLGIDIASLASADPIVIDVIRIADFSTTAAVNAKGKNNISALQDNVNRYAGSSEAKSASDSSEEGPPTLLRVKKFSAEGGRVSADLTAIGGKKMETKIPAIRLSNLGGSKGSPPAEFGAQIATQFVKSITAAVAKSAVGTQARKLLGAGADKITVDGAKGMIKGLLDR